MTKRINKYATYDEIDKLQKQIETIKTILAMTIGFTLVSITTIMLIL